MSTAFQDLIGNKFLKTILTRMVEKGVVGNSLLFAGPDGIGKSLFAVELAKLLFEKNDPSGIHRQKIISGTHPDVRVYRPSGKLGLHTIEAMRQFSEEVYQTPDEAQWKVFIIHDADRMLPYSANALLKTFEEPLLNCLIILLSHLPEALLPTILSRCRIIHFQPISEEDLANYFVTHFKKTSQDALVLARKAQGSLARALHLEKEGSYPWSALLFATLTKGAFSSYNELQKNAADIEECIERIKTEAEEIARQELLEGVNDTLSASQQEVIEKTIEGIASMRFSDAVDALFYTILSWYRDLHLLHIKGDPKYLMNCDYQTQLEEILQKNDLIALEDVEKALAKAKLAIQRSTNLSICLEGLFFKLNLL
jgi:DNA polymerase-3 subunit delta'